MVRSYLRHGPTQAFGIITSPIGNSAFDGRLAFVPGWEDVLVWDVKMGEMISMWHSTGITSPITSLLPAPLPSSSTSTSPRIFAVAYQDGSIRLWSFDSAAPRDPTEIVTFNGHKKSITQLTFDNDGSRLASGGTEGEIVLWDRLAEVGLFRLKGHRAPITGLAFIPHPELGTTSHAGFLASTAKDGYLKLWDLSTQHCVQTVVVGKGEVSSLAAQEEDGEEDGSGRWILLSGSADGEAKAWVVKNEDLAKGMAENANGELPTLVQPLCTLPLPASSSPIIQIAFHPSQPLILLQTSDRVTTVLRLRTEEEVAAKRARRKKRDREKGRKKGDEGAEQENDEADDQPVKWEERVQAWCIVRSNAKVKSFSLGPEDASVKGGISLLLALSNNSLETYTLPSPSTTRKSKLPDGKTPEPSKTHTLEIPGHRQDIRALAISSDDQVIASAASGTLKIWNARTTACLRTMECGYAICATFLPGDRHVVIGTKTGELMLYDIAASSLLSSYKAHNGPVWGVHVKPDGRGLVSGSADKDVKFWDFEMREDGEGEKVVSRLGVETVHKTKQLALVHVKTLKMTDDVLAVKYSPDGRFLAVSLLDSTVKIFFSDTLKFFLSLYGHKLPVLSLDISSDSKLIVTCAADKNVKIWGMDFGDCHKSIFAHDDSIMQVAFEKESHYFWTVGKDRMLKYWDGDKFELIQKLEGHHGEIWALAVSNRGEYVVTGSHDKSIRIWEKTDEPLFLEEEREKELEQLYSAENDANTQAKGDDEDEVEAVHQSTEESLMAGEKIMEAIELADAEREALEAYEEEVKRLGPEKSAGVVRPERSAELKARGDISGEEYVWKTLKSVPAASMEDALLVLPFRQVVSLLVYLDSWAKNNRDIVLASRILAFLLRTHSSQLIATRTLRTQLLELRGHLRKALDQDREIMGYNLAALKYLKGRVEAESNVGIWDEETVRDKMGKKGKSKRKRIEVRA
ncbi:putative WD-repeat protein [Papiliotrema laurentii]|uniref:WD-repeat protein n=1 Tax=Papiliotrema laurentii TaxID=5418 RepID=A0AAD9D062_PAPLA|nr:putative WD-repeat protein [Papiliotrema laurentii]